MSPKSHGVNTSFGAGDAGGQGPSSLDAARGDHGRPGPSPGPEPAGPLFGSGPRQAGVPGLVGGHRPGPRCFARSRRPGPVMPPGDFYSTVVYRS